MKLYNIFEELILENISRNSIVDAINNRYVVNINYAGDDNTAQGPRYIEVYAFGLSKSNNPVIRAFQLAGDSKTLSPQWKMFRVDRIKRWEPTQREFNKPRNGFNPNGDNAMSVVHNITKF
jgi:predicted DNA-binding transcriptional regulator YafY